jgi:ornithine decarboxylase
MSYLQKCIVLCKKYLLSGWLYAENRAIEKNPEKTQNGDQVTIENKYLLNSTSTQFSYNLSELRSVDEVVLEMQPYVPLYCIRPKTLEAAAANFISSFPGQVLYAVKCNPEPRTLQMLWNGGIRHFDCASINEIRMINKLFPSAKIHFMHPIKDKKAIHDAYFNYGVRSYAVDSIEEVEKIVAVTGNAEDLGIFVRIKVAAGSAMYDLSHKFGATEEEVGDVLQRARSVAKRLGICFHVGSQCMDPESYESALTLVKEIITKTNVKIDIIDVGGGFPGSYIESIPPPLNEFHDAIKRGFDKLNLPEGTELWCEPGRALVYAGCSLVVKVLARKENALYINDGVFGILGEAGEPVYQAFPMRVIRLNGSTVTTIENEKLESFSFYGPTCDTFDSMDGPFELPHNIKVDDYIEIGQIGAYGIALNNTFNGFGEIAISLVSDDPLEPTPED